MNIYFSKYIFLNYLRIWDLKARKIIKMAELDNKIRSCSFSHDESALACGLSDGVLVVLNTSYKFFFL